MSASIPILLYHSISEAAAPRYRRWAVRPATFAAQMAYLHDQRYSALTVTQLVERLVDRSRPMPERPVVITFDDGYTDFCTGALPVLKRYGFAATLYITTGFVGSTSRWLHRAGESERAMLTWRQVAEVSASGIECGAHSHSHHPLDLLTPAAARDEIVRSKSILEHRLGQPVPSFAYPHGYYTPAVRRMVREAGFSSACAVKDAMSTTADDRFALARIIIAAETGVADFAGLLLGRGLSAAPARRRVRTAGWQFVRRVTGLLRRDAVAVTCPADLPCPDGERDDGADESARRPLSPTAVLAGATARKEPEVARCEPHRCG